MSGLANCGAAEPVRGRGFEVSADGRRTALGPGDTLFVGGPGSEAVRFGAKRYRGGEVKLLGFFVGEVMKRSKGKADPKAVQAKVKEALG